VNALLGKSNGKKRELIDTGTDQRYAVRRTDNTGRDKPSHYRIEYDYEAKTVKVTAHAKPLTGIHDNNQAERDDNTGARKINAIYVEADKIEDLKAA
jgi:hypothetical protein